MNTKVLMTASAVIFGIIGIALSFIPEEITTYLNIESNIISTLSFQLIGALYLGFSMMNWMAKSTTIGGIYNRPITIGNFMHFFVGALALIKMVSKVELHQEVIIGLIVVYSIFAISFAYIFRTNPKSLTKK